MRKHLIGTLVTSGTSATLALILIGAISACDGTPRGVVVNPSPADTCVNASAPHRAYVVVQHLSGTSVQKCVGFTADAIDGQTLMDQSKIQFETQTFSFGKAACQIDNEPVQFTKCVGANQPYWSLWVQTAAKWTSAQTGYTDVKLHHKEALGWHFVQSTDPSPAPPPLAKP